MKLCCCVCFFVLAAASFARGQNETSVDQRNERNNTTETLDRTALTTDGASDSAPTWTSPTSPNGTSDLSEGSTGSTGTAAPTATAASPSGGAEGQPSGTDAMTTTGPPAVKAEPESWVYILLVFILVLIVVLCVIVYLLWRSSKVYSFDLQRPHPVSRSTEPIGTFEPVHLDDLDHPDPKDHVTSSDLSPPSAANGTSLPSGDNDPVGENAAQELTNGLEAPPPGPAHSSASIDQSDRISEQSSSMNLFFDAIGDEQQNENNNNPSVCCSDPFVEINLDEPAWSDHLLSYPQTTSSVLPFSPYSFSSSSSSS